VSLGGSVAGLTGAAVVAAVGAIGGVGAQRGTRVFAAACVAGVMGMFLDSVLGATVQASFRRADGRLGEEPAVGTMPARGIPWITNPVVNGLATLAGAILAALFYWVVNG
jgi:uncharacterized membrane protein